jgi:hypothetical protein
MKIRKEIPDEEVEDSDTEENYIKELITNLEKD